MEITRKEIIEVFKLWTDRFIEGNASELEEGTEEYNIACADYFMELAGEIKDK